MAAVVAALAGAAVLLLGGGGGGYTVYAEFLDAGQLVKGNVVEIAGQRIGSVSALRLNDRGRAELELSIADEHAPLHRGTRLRIRTVGLSGVANRYVDVTPGSRRGPAIPDGGRIDTLATTGIVDLDMLLNALGPEARRDIRELLGEGAAGLRGRESAVNRLLAYLSPAVGQTRALLEDVGADQAGVDRLVASSATVARALATRRADVEEGISSAATTLEAIATEREAVRGTLSRAPPVLRRARGTLGGTRAVLADLRPALREARPVAGPLSAVLRRLVPTTRAARPAVRALADLLGPLTETLRAAPGLAATAMPALRSANSAIAGGRPVFEALRAYSLDSLQGFALGAGNVGGQYDANGNYVRIIGNFDLTRSGFVGFPSLLPDIDPPSLAGRFRGATARCPGSAAGRLRDGSGLEELPGRCDPAHGRVP